jgi:hypothetical protein
MREFVLVVTAGMISSPSALASAGTRTALQADPTD